MKGGLVSMIVEKEKKDLPKRKMSFSRHLFFFLIFLLVVILFTSLAFVICSGPLVNSAVSGMAGKYFSQFAHLNIHFENLSGNPLEGYALSGLSIGDKTTPDILVARKIFVKFDVQESWAQQKIILSGTLDGLRVKENKINELQVAIEEQFQLRTNSDPFTPFAFFIPKNFSGVDWASDSGWKLSEISFDLIDSEKLIYKFAFCTEYLEEQIQVDGTTGLSEEAMPLWADLRLRARDSDVTAEASLKDGRVVIKNIEGKALNTPLSGGASIDFAQDDPEISADFSLRSIDLSPLNKEVPRLGPTTVENLKAHVSGSIAHPVCEFSIENGNLVWQSYKISDIEASGILAGKDLSVEVSGSAYGATIEASGSLGLSADSPLDLGASIASLQLQELEKFFPDLEPLALEGVASAKITASGPLAQPTAHINIKSPKISLQKEYVFSDVGASIIASTSKLTLQNFSAEAFKGKISASGNLSLDENSQLLSLRGNLSQLDLSAFGDIVGKLDGNFSVGGTVARPNIDLEAKIDTLTYAQFSAKNIVLSARGSDVLDVQLEGSTKMNTPFGGGGKITLRGVRSAMDLKFNLDRLTLSEIFPHTMRISGEINMALLIGGSFENPEVSAIISSPEIFTGNYKIADSQLNAVLNGRKIDIDASIAVGDRRASVKGTLDFENGLKNVSNTTANSDSGSTNVDASYFGKGFKCVLDIAAPSVRIDFLLPWFAGKLYGRVTMRSHAVITEGGVELTGSVTSPMLGASGIHATNISVPFIFKDKKLEISDGILSLGNGMLNFRADGDIESDTYTFALSGKNIDLKKLAEPIDLPAQIEGNAEMAFGGKITTGFTTLVRAGGRIQLKDLSVDKFRGQTAIIGNSPLKIENGNFIIKIDDDEVYLMPGSSISAPPDDKIYNFISFTGTLWKIHRDPPNLAPELLPEDLLENNDDMYRIHINGSINLRVLNGLLSGFGAVMDAGAAGDMSTESIASSFVQRYITGRIGTQYRAFDLDIAGKDYRELRINNLKFEGEGNSHEVDTTEWRRDSGQVKDDQRYSFNYGLPIGRDPLREEKKKARQERAAARKKRKKTAAEKTPDNANEN